MQLKVVVLAISALLASLVITASPIGGAAADTVTNMGQSAPNLSGRYVEIPHFLNENVSEGLGVFTLLI
ncbi:hypothetical protein TESG_08441 [Trichophyton tonsurans CBS 112818]|uniref:Uncharacterized protein n=1 Tax=Trichophyton tonsurans (strain CBS 112818) TaxID=647933 RepID=F2RYM9_TRIT1|nr:hypothetical protein TESG_08441 [Trichophyton tonsurans CBS 112818]